MNTYLIYGLRECPIRIKAHRLSLEYSHVGHILLLDESSNVIACLNNSYTVIKDDTQQESLDEVSSLDLNEELSNMGVSEPIDVADIFLSEDAMNKVKDSAVLTISRWDKKYSPPQYSVDVYHIDVDNAIKFIDSPDRIKKS